MTTSERIPLLRLDRVNTFYGPIHILQDVSIDIFPNELVCLLGGNASGKSTTLKAILGTIPVSSGTVEFLGEPVQDRRRATGSAAAWRWSRRIAVSSGR